MWIDLFPKVDILKSIKIAAFGLSLDWSPSTSSSSLDECWCHDLRLTREAKLPLLDHPRLEEYIWGGCCRRKPSAALPSHRMGGFYVSSWLPLLPCIE